ncbi:hypothetical protein D9758_007342 [Tetrapyrgos nigripes]|uniref:non-specific serine/threonine protein kinase n=1 Tax=Tetrapyrgos nigripes TaxID=182062 RepID=A0A8H5GAY6_9AGAR|nr:hypothetical protein D9758_007342 [Tetrapyrgos nigripes]
MPASTAQQSRNQVSGLPRESDHSHYRDIHMETARGLPPSATAGIADIHMLTAKGLTISDDIRMDTARGHTGTVRALALPLKDREILESSEVKRKATVAQLYFLDYYFQALGYLASRKERRALFDKDTKDRGLTASEYSKEFRSYCGRERVLLRKRRTKLRVDQFHIIAQVGQGGYGEVFLARKQETGEVCALKRMKKRTLHKMDEIRHVLIERDILTATKSAWLVKLLYAFQDAQYVYLAMEYVPGGDFRTLLNNSGVLKEEHARYYISEMFAAVNELHKLGYIHRDLKPENFLVDGTGHVKLTDFGLATGALNPKRIESIKIKLDKVKDNQVIHRSTMERRSIYRSIRNEEPRYADSIVGSPDYMAPEVLRGKPYTYSVDYWSLGCIFFEFLAGFPPFSGSTPEETWTNLKNWTTVLRRPEYDKPEDLIFNLSDVAWDAVTWYVSYLRFYHFSSLTQARDTPPWAKSPPTPSSPNASLQSNGTTSVPPVHLLFQPSTRKLTLGYYDDFTSAEDMAKYAEVREKQKNVDNVREKEEPFARGVWVGFTFGKNGPGAHATKLGGLGDSYGDETDGTLATIF